LGSEESPHLVGVEGYPDMAGSSIAAIIGPTAVGKSYLAVELCEQFNGEIVSADSRQIYRGLDIGTAKPTLRDRSRVPHHLVDLIPPDRQLSLAEYQDLAYQAITDVHSRGRLPFLVGGTGQYVKAVLEGWSIPRVPPQPHLREEMQKRSPQALHEWLTEVDPITARRIDVRNVRRIIRALEVYQVVGRPISEVQKKCSPDYSTLQLGLTMERRALYERIDQRIERMMEEGLLDEVRSLIARGYAPQLSAMSGIGYAELVKHLQGDIDLEEAIRRVKSHTRRFVRHQYNWFRRGDPQIRWIDQGQGVVGRAATIIQEWLQSGQIGGN
jgi:tRNA dimethylallyltransferase